MLAKVLPLAIALIGLGAGVGAGIALRPEPEPEHAQAIAPCGEAPGADGHAAADAAAGDHGTGKAPAAAGHGAAAKDHGGGGDHGSGDTEFVKLSDNFIVPVLRGGAVSSMVVLSLTLEVASGQGQAVFDREPKLRDAFLRELLNHANRGGFDGAFTTNGAIEKLHLALSETGQQYLGDVLQDVLILNINRQDML